MSATLESDITLSWHTKSSLKKFKKVKINVFEKPWLEKFELLSSRLDQSKFSQIFASSCSDKNSLQNWQNAT